MTRYRYAPSVWSAAIACGLAIGLTSGCSSPPQLGGEEALTAADALWTAVTSRRTELLDQALAQCATLKEQGTLSDAAHAELVAVGETAREGDWEAAAKRLKKLIQAQRSPAPSTPP